MLLASTPSANGIKSSLLGTFSSQRTAPKAIRMRLTTTWPASRSRNSAIRGMLSDSEADSLQFGFEIGDQRLDGRGDLRVQRDADSLRQCGLVRRVDRCRHVAEDAERNALDGDGRLRPRSWDQRRDPFDDGGI